jgi:hypothetical protein
MSVNSLNLNEKKVDLSVKFYRIGEIDIMNERFFAELKLKSSWIDSNVIDAYDMKKHWNPRIVIENAFTKSEEQVEYELTKVGDQTLVLEIRKIKVRYKHACIR